MMSVQRFPDESEAIAFMEESDILGDCEDGFLYCNEVAASDYLRGTLDDLRVYSLVDHVYKDEELDEGKDGAASRDLYFRRGAVAGYVEFTDEHPSVVREEGKLVDVLPMNPEDVALAEKIFLSIRDRLDELATPTPSAPPTLANETPVARASPTSIPTSPVAQGLSPDVERAGFEALVTASLWSSASDLLIELQGLTSADGRGSQRDAIWYSYQLALYCQFAENDFPMLWNRVGGACDEAEAAHAAGLMGLVDSQRYGQALPLAQAVGDTALQHLLQLARIENPTYELLTTASLTAHAVGLSGELRDLTSAQSDSTPDAAALLSQDVSVDCEMAADKSPDLWTSVSDECQAVESAQIWNLVDSGQYERALRLADALGIAVSSHLTGLCNARE
jgi:hypothetical protein